MVLEDPVVPSGGLSFTSETKYGITTLLNKAIDNPQLGPFELKTYSDGSTNYETGSVIHQNIMMNDITVAYYIVGGITYYQTWYEVSQQPNDLTKYTEVKYGSSTGVKTQLSSIANRTVVPIDYQNLFNA